MPNSGEAASARGRDVGGGGLTAPSADGACAVSPTTGWQSRFLALALGKPLLVEGVPGVGKTEAAKALAAALGRDLVRLQCFEGIDAAQALYEWNHARQLLAIRQTEARGKAPDLYAEEFLLERPLLRALRQAETSVLLIDEIDRADDEFEAFLLEFLADYEITIPEIGTVVPPAPPVVVLTSNRTRELHEALRRRCTYHWIPYPDPGREAEIIMLRASEVAEEAARAVVAAVNGLRKMPLVKAPGIAEAVDWARAAHVLDDGGGDWPLALKRSIGQVLKDEEDMQLVAGHLDELVGGGGEMTASQWLGMPPLSRISDADSLPRIGEIRPPRKGGGDA